MIFMRKLNRTALLLVPAAVLGISLAACGPDNGSASSSASGTVSHAKVAASAADTQLKKDGYTALHAPGFGKVDLGIRNTAPKYELVYTYGGKNPALVQNIAGAAQKKLIEEKQTGVTIKTSGSLVIVQANSLSTLRTALKAVVSSVK